MIQIAIVDDDAAYREQLQGYLAQFSRETGTALQVTVFTDGDEIATRYHAAYDLIFLDIQMCFMDGMTAAEHIRALDSEVMIIFITNSPQYAIRGYSVGALDYILKPVTYFAFSEKLRRALSHIKPHEKKYLSLTIDGGLARISIDSIFFIESFQHYIIIHTKTGKKQLLGTMKDMEANLANDHFYRCHNGYLVNLAHVESVRDSMVTVGGNELQISRPRRKEFMKILTEYMGATR